VIIKSLSGLMEKRQKKLRHGNENSAQEGFTLMEITFAILILAGSLVILLGLQSSVIHRTIQDSQKLRAIMCSRQILSAIEARTEPLEIQDTTSSVKRILESLIRPDPSDEEDLEKLDDFSVRLLVEYLELPKTGPDSIKRIQLTLSWGDTPAESLEVVFFTPTTEEDFLDEEDEDEFDEETL